MDNDHTYEVSSSQEEIFSNGWAELMNTDIPWSDALTLDQLPEEMQYLIENEVGLVQRNEIYDVTQVDGSECQPLPDQIFKEEVAETPPLQENVVEVPSYTPSSLPASENWAGEYGFTFSLDKAAKGQWTYSSDLNKLFVVKDAACPINFFTKCAMPEDTYIKAMVLYSSPESVSEVVKRCENHSAKDRKKNLVEAEHLIRCDSKTAMYGTDPITKHLMVLTPFDNPAVGQSFSTYIYKFTCLGSCPGPDRRPLMIVFTLISGNQVVGRCKLNVKICACPKRDKGTEENKFFDQGSNKRMKPKKKRTACELESMLPGPSVVPLPKKVKTATPNSDGFYQLKVKDRKCLEFLEQMKKYYEIVNTVKSLPPKAREVLEKYQQRKGYNVDLDLL